LRELSPKRGFHFRHGIYSQTIEPECLERCSPLQERRTNILVVLIEILLLVRTKPFKLGYDELTGKFASLQCSTFVALLKSVI
jgi:hypothetical protein